MAVLWHPWESRGHFEAISVVIGQRRGRFQLRAPPPPPKRPTCCQDLSTINGVGLLAEAILDSPTPREKAPSRSTGEGRGR
eukprot:1937495-Pyramimonas_sp.AAC.1